MARKKKYRNFLITKRVIRHGDELRFQTAVEGCGACAAFSVISRLKKVRFRAVMITPTQASIESIASLLPDFEIHLPPPNFDFDVGRFRLVKGVKIINEHPLKSVRRNLFPEYGTPQFLVY